MKPLDAKLFEELQQRSIGKVQESLIQYLTENNPYPPDIFKSKVGRAARTGYDACIDYVKRFFTDLDHARSAEKKVVQ